VSPFYKILDDNKPINKTWGSMNIEIKRIKMCQDSLTHTSKTKDAQKRLIETKLPKYAQIEGVRNQAEIHSICLPHVKVHKIIEFSINTID